MNAPVIPGYDIEGELGRGTSSVVYRARHGSTPVALKVMRGQHTDMSAVRFVREAAALARVQHPSLVQVYDAGTHAGASYVALELVEGRTLSSLLAVRPVPEDQLAKIAKSLGGALAALHHYGLLHRDVKPHNALLDVKGDVRLIDLGFASTASTQAEGGAIGTLSYSAPEQTGMLKRAVDGRADLYSLGVVLYECATQERPFDAPSVAELLKLHAAVVAPDVRLKAPQVSPAMASIIARLLAKDPDDRYQSGEALLIDLDRLPELNEALAAGAALPPQRLPSLPPVREALAGRSAERTKLTAHWHYVRRGRGHVVLVEGDPGVGKTRLLDEALAEARGDGALVLKGKCSEADPTPFSPLARAIDGMLSDAEQLHAGHRAALFADVKTAAKGLEPLLAGLSSPLAQLLAAPAPKTSTGEVQAQFLQAVVQFLVELSKLRQGLVLLLDDVHWLDESTRQVLRRLTPELSRAPLQVLASARVGPEYAVATSRFAADFGAALWLRLTLGPLDVRGVAELMQQLMGRVPVPVALSELVARRTQGNALSVVEYVRALLDGGHVRPGWQGWQLDTEGLQRLELPGDVSRLLSRRLEALEPEHRAVLAVAALDGSLFVVDEVAAAAELPREVVADAVIAATTAQLIERLTPTRYAFVHDRVREALLLGLPAAKVQAMHQAWAQAFSTTALHERERLYSRARHAVQGQPELNPGLTYEALVSAGEAAASSHAAEEAYGFLSHALELARAHELPVDAKERAILGRAAAATGRFAHAVEALEQAIAGSSDAPTRAELYGELAVVRFGQMDVPKAQVELQRAFSALGFGYPSGRRGEWWATLAQWVCGWLSVVTTIGLGRARGALRERAVRLAKLYGTAFTVSYFDVKQVRILQLGLRGLYLGSLLGMSPEAGALYSSYSSLLGLLGFKRASERYVKRSARCVEHVDDPMMVAQLRYGLSLSRHLSGDARTAQALGVEALGERGQWLNPNDFIKGAIDLGWNFLMRGYATEGLWWSERALERQLATAPRGHTADRHYAVWTAGALAMLGRHAEAESRLKEGHTDDQKTVNQEFRTLAYLGFRLLALTESGQWGEAAEQTIAQYLKLKLKPKFHLRHFYAFWVHLRLSQALQADAAQRPEALAKLNEADAQLRKQARVPVMQAHRLLSSAALAWLSGDLKKGQALLAKADEMAVTVDSPWVAYGVALQRAYIAKAANDAPAAQRYAACAHALAMQHQWQGRARALREQFALQPAVGVHDSTRTTLGSSGGDALRLKRNLDALLQVSMASARAVKPDAVMRQVLDELLRIFGAERAFLFLDAEQPRDLPAHEALPAASVASVGRDASGNDLQTLDGYSKSLVERCRVSGEPVVHAGSEQGPAPVAESIAANELRSLMAAPLRTRDRVVGVVYLDSRLARGVFAHDDVEVLQAIANHVAIAVDNARANTLELEVETARQRRDLAEELAALSSELNATLDGVEVMSRLLDGVWRVAKPQAAMVVLDGPRGLQPVAKRGLTSEGDWSELMQWQSTGFARLTELMQPTRLEVGFAGQHFWFVPVVVRKQTRGGVLVLPSGSNWSGTQEPLVMACAAQAAVALENARLFEEVKLLATTDALTQVASRRHLFVLAERELQRARRSNEPLSVMMIDIDHFKSINDTKGHLAGDQVLREVAQRLKAALRDFDVIGRYGGEEFAVVLPNCRLEQARDLIAERLRLTVSDRPVTTDHGDVSVTISIGVARASGEQQSVTQLWAPADQALYEAKRTGRNRVVMAATSEPAVSAVTTV